MVQGLLHGMELWTEWGWEWVLGVSTQTPASGLRDPTSLGCWDCNLLETQRIGRPRPRPFQGGQSPTYNKGTPCPWEESEGPDPVWGHRTLACTAEQVLLPRLSFIRSPHWPGQSPSLSGWHLHTALPAWGLQGAETVPPDTYCLWVFIIFPILLCLGEKHKSPGIPHLLQVCKHGASNGHCSPQVHTSHVTFSGASGKPQETPLA